MIQVIPLQPPALRYGVFRGPYEPLHFVAGLYGRLRSPLSEVSSAQGSRVKMGSPQPGHASAFFHIFSADETHCVRLGSAPGETAWPAAERAQRGPGSHRSEAQGAGGEHLLPRPTPATLTSLILRPALAPPPVTVKQATPDPARAAVW